MAAMTRDDFAIMEFNPFGTGGVPIQDYYPAIKSRRQLYEKPIAEEYSDWAPEDISELLSIVIMIVDKQSPLSADTDLSARITAAKALVEPSRKVLFEIKAGGPFMQRMIKRMFAYINDMDYEEWFSLRMQFSNAMEYLRRPIDEDMDPNKSARLAESARGLKQRIQKIEAKMFNSERLLQVVQEEALAEQDSLGGYAEEFAEPGPWAVIGEFDDDDDS